MCGSNFYESDVSKISRRDKNCCRGCYKRPGGPLGGPRTPWGSLGGSKESLGTRNKVEVDRTKIVAVAATKPQESSGRFRRFTERPYCTANATVWVEQHYVFIQAARGRQYGYMIEATIQ